MSKCFSKSRKGKGPHYEIGVGVIIQNGRVLIARRGDDQMLGGLWEFPGGKREPGESLEQTVIREVEEEMGLKVGVDRLLCKVKHAYSHFRITLYAYLCQIRGGDLKHHRNHPVAWVSREQLSAYPLPEANAKILERLDDVL